MAFHNPGAVKAAMPTTVAWKNTPRNQLYLRVLDVERASSESGVDADAATLCLTFAAMTSY